MKNILFVDDEAGVLAGLRSRLRHLQGEWDMAFLESGEAALEALEGRAYDVIVTDVRMPRMDGEELLRIVSSRWPQMIRMVLSGYAEPRQIARLTTLVHQYVSQPCDCVRLENLIKRCLALQELLEQPRLRALVGRIRSLPAMPHIYSQLRALLTREEVTAGEVAQLISADPAVTAKIVQLVNSAFFRLPRRITRIEQAVAYLGFDAIRSLALSVEVFSSFPSSTVGGCLDLEKLQRHAQAVAGAARALAPEGLADDAMLAGLLHDIGYWILAAECPADLARAVEQTTERGIPLHEAEGEVIGASHAELGAYLLGLWGLPYTVIEAVACHHTPQCISQQEFDLVGVLAVSHALVEHDDADAFAKPLVADPPVDAAYLKALRAPYSWAEAERRVAATLDEVSP